MSPTTMNINFFKDYPNELLEVIVFGKKKYENITSSPTLQSEDPDIVSTLEKNKSDLISVMLLILLKSIQSERLKTKLCIKLLHNKIDDGIKFILRGR